MNAREGVHLNTLAEVGGAHVKAFHLGLGDIQSDATLLEEEFRDAPSGDVEVQIDLGEFMLEAGCLKGG